MPLFQAGPAVQIKLSADQIGTVVYLDGVLVQGVKNIALNHKAGEVASIVLEVLPSSLIVEGECRDVLIRLLKGTNETETETETETPAD